MDMQNSSIIRFLKLIILIISASLTHVKGQIKMPKELIMEEQDEICNTIGKLVLSNKSL